MLRPAFVHCFAALGFALLVPAGSMAQESQPGYTEPASSPAPAPSAAPVPYPAPAPAAAPAPYSAPGAFSAPAPYSQPLAASTPPGFHEHDGFYFHYLVGPGYLYNTASASGATMKMTGVGFAGALAVGGAIANNLILYGQVVAASVSDPTVDVDGQSATADGATVTFAGLGPGLAYYLGGNTYLATTLALTQLGVRDSGHKVVETDMGFGASVGGGKEWWVSDNWGLGLAGQIVFASMKEKDADYRWTSLSFALLFSATYN